MAMIQRLATGFALLISLSLVGCGPSHTPRIGVSVATMQEAVYSFMQQAMLDRKNADGVEIVWVSAENSEAKQMSDVNGLLSQGIDVLILHAVNTATARELVSRATEAGVRVVAMDRLPTGAPVRLYVTADSRKAGRLQAEYLVRRLGDRGKVIILEGEEGNSVARDITEGNLDILKSHAQIQIVLRQPHKNWARDLAMQTTGDVLDRFKGDIQGILANNSGMAMGAVEALAKHKHGQKIVVVGSDADRDACGAILDGSLAADIDKRPYELGLAAYQSALQIIRNVPVTSDTRVANAGVEVEVKWTPVHLIEQENVRREMAYRWGNL